MRRASLRRRLLRSLQGTLYWTGAAWTYVRLRRIHGATLLMYHSVVRPSDERWIDPRYSIPAELFEAQMSFLSRRRRVIPIDELLNTLARGADPPPGTVLITFDDGYRNNLEVALPILIKYRLPAIIYLATGYVRTGQPQWVDQLYAIFSERTCDNLELAGPQRRRFALGSPDALRTAYAQLASRLLPADRRGREAVFQQLEEQLCPAARPPRLTLTWDEVRSMIRAHPALDIGVHTAYHIDLSSCDPKTAREELIGSVDDVKLELGQRPQHFSYPYGRAPTWTKTVLKQLRFRSAVTSGPMQLATRRTDVLALPRVDPDKSRSLFRYTTGGAHPGLTMWLFRRASCPRDSPLECGGGPY